MTTETDSTGEIDHVEHIGLREQPAHLRAHQALAGRVLGLFLHEVEKALKRRRPEAPRTARFGAVSFVHPDDWSRDFTEQASVRAARAGDRRTVLQISGKRTFK